MAKKPKILVIGSFVMDLIVRAERFPGAGETVLGKDFRTAPGGKGANQAVQAARLGADVTMVGKVGNDDFGKRLVASAREAGIHTEHVSVDPSVSSAVGNVQLEVKGGETRNRIIVVPGANGTISPGDVAFLKDAVGEYDMVILQHEIPMEINELAAEYAHGKGVPVMLNPAPSAPLSSGLLSRLTYISPNEHEAADLTGVAIRRQGKRADPDDLRAAAAALLKKGVENAVITLGSAGAVAADRDGMAFEPCADVVEVKDPTAAGDSFVAAFSVAACLGLDRRQALHFASYAAALTVSRMGAQPSLPKLGEVVALMEREHALTFDPAVLDGLKQKA